MHFLKNQIKGIIFYYQFAQFFIFVNEYCCQFYVDENFFRSFWDRIEHLIKSISLWPVSGAVLKSGKDI